MKLWLRIFLGGIICLVLAALALWLFRLPLATAALRKAGVEQAKLQSLRLDWPDTLRARSLSGRTGGIRFLLEDGSARIKGWRVLGEDLHLQIDGARLILSETFSLSDPEEPADETSPPPDGGERAEPATLPQLPGFSLTLRDLSLLPVEDADAWAVVSGEWTGGVSRQLNLSAETLLGGLDLEARFGDGSGEGRVRWDSAGNPDWDNVFPPLRDRGLVIPENTGAGWKNLAVSLDADWTEEQTSWHLGLQSESTHFRQEDFSLTTGELEAELRGDYPLDSLPRDGTWTALRIHLQVGEDWLSAEEVTGSLAPPANGSTARIHLSGGVATVSEVRIEAITADATLSPGGDEGMDATVKATARVFAGSVEADIKARVEPFSPANAAVNLTDVSLGDINERFGFFDGKIDARVRGRVEAKWEQGLLTLLPSTLEMVPGTEGTLQYEKSGWMTGDPDLDVVALSEKLRIDQLLTRDDSAGILVELAARNLTVTRLRIALFEPDLKDRKGEINLEGYSMVQNTRIPVVLKIPLRGDLQESIRLLLRAGRL